MSIIFSLTLQIFPLLSFSFSHHASMKSLLCIAISLLLISCSAPPYDGSIVEIVGNRSWISVVRGMWVCISDGRVLTSAHVVSDDRDTYMIWETPYSISERDIMADRAYLERDAADGYNPCLHTREYIWKTDTQNIGDIVAIPVMRDSTLIYLTGYIITTTGTILAYDTRWQSRVLSGMVLTDVQLLPGDSWSPILDGQGRVIDIVHVE